MRSNNTAAIAVLIFAAESHCNQTAGVSSDNEFAVCVEIERLALIYVNEAR